MLLPAKLSLKSEGEIKTFLERNSLVGQWWGLSDSTAGRWGTGVGVGGQGLIPGFGTKILHAMQHGNILI